MIDEGEEGGEQKEKREEGKREETQGGAGWGERRGTQTSRRELIPEGVSIPTLMRYLSRSTYCLHPFLR